MRALPLILVAVLSACPPIDEPEIVDPPPAEVVSFGSVTVLQAVQSHQVQAFFDDVSAPALAAGCTSQEIVGCTLVTCDAPVPPAEANAPSLDAGSITVKSPRLEHTLTLGEDGAYETISVEAGEFFLNAEEIKANVAGGADADVVALAVFAPTRIQLTTPPLQSVNVSVLDPIDIAWSNSSAGELEATLTDAGLTRVATCKASAQGSGMSIPAEIVGRFPVGGGRLELAVATTTTTTVDTTLVTFRAVSSVTSPTGTAASYNVFFQAP